MFLNLVYNKLYTDMAHYETLPIDGGNDKIPEKYKNIDIVEVDSIGRATIDKIVYLLNTTKRFFILKSKNGWQYMSIQFIPSDVPPTVSSKYTDVSASFREKTTPILMSLEELEATRTRVASPFRPRRKKLQKSGKKVSKKSGKVRKNKKSKKLRN